MPSSTPFRSASQPPRSGEFESLFHARPHLAQSGHVDQKRPVEICVQDLSHLAVCGGEARRLLTVRKQLTEMNSAGVGHRETERGLFAATAPAMETGAPPAARGSRRACSFRSNSRLYRSHLGSH